MAVAFHTKTLTVYEYSKENFSLPYSVHTGSWAHPASYPIVKRSGFLGRKEAGT
jgi:hypothetical protein